MLFSEVHLQITNCTQMNPGLDSVGNPTCKACANGTLLTYSGYECLTCTSPCTTCYGLPTICLSCAPGFWYDAVKHSCTACSIGAKNCLSNGTINSCFEAYFLASNRKACLSCPENCLECNSTRNCNKCVTEFSKKTIRGADICAVSDQDELRRLSFFSTFGVAVLLFILLCTSSVCHYQRRKELEIKEVEQINEASLRSLLNNIGLARLLSAVSSPTSPSTPRSSTVCSQELEQEFTEESPQD